MSLEKATETAIDQLYKLTKAVQPLAKDSNAVAVMLYFDEAHNLAPSYCTYYDTRSFYQVLLSVLNDYKAYSMFAVFLSTTPQISTFAPPRAMANGDRAVYWTAYHAPITETPFDCAPNLFIRQNVHTREQVAEVRFMAQFGRPL